MKILACALLSLTAATASAQIRTVPPPPITYDQAVSNERHLFIADQNHDLDTIRRRSARTRCSRRSPPSRC